MLPPALRHRDFRLFLCSQASSFFANAIQQVAVTWLIFRESHSATTLGTAGLLTGLPMAVSVFFAGAITDRGHAKRLLAATQVGWAILDLLLCGLVTTSHLNTNWLIILSALLGVVNGIDAPVRQVLATRLVPQSELNSAVSLNSLIYDSARLLGPAIGGVLLAHLFGASIFLLCGIIHLAAWALQWMIRGHLKLAAHPQDDLDRTPGQYLPGGTAYTFALLSLLALIAFAGTSYTTLLPVKASLLHGGAKTLGLLWSSIGCGAIVGGLWMSNLGKIKHAPHWIAISVAIFAVTLIALSRSTQSTLCFLGLAIIGLSIMVMMAASSNVLFRITPRRQQGRVLSLFNLSYMAMAPFGALYTGLLASKIGVDKVFCVNGLASLLAALAFAIIAPGMNRLLKHIPQPAPSTAATTLEEQAAK